MRQGKHDEAEKMQREVLDARAEHPYTLITANNLADSLKRQGSLFMCVRVCIYVLVPRVVHVRYEVVVACERNVRFAYDGLARTLVVR
jgi:hypothetical protein